MSRRTATRHAPPRIAWTARQLGAHIVIGVDVVYPPHHASLTNSISVLFQTVTISTYRHLLREREQADLAIVRVIPPTGDLALSGPRVVDRRWRGGRGRGAAGAAGRVRAALTDWTE